MTETPNLNPRMIVEIAPGLSVGTYEPSVDHVDGEMRVTCGWDEDGYWVAEAFGMNPPNVTGSVIGTGGTKEKALADLVVAMVAHMRAVGGADV